LSNSADNLGVVDPPAQTAGHTATAASLTPIQWLVCAVACLGFAFDLYETLMMALLVRPALTDLGHLRPGTPAFNMWVGLLFYLPNVAAGIFGLLGGYFTDLFGRKRILVWSILFYSFRLALPVSLLPSRNCCFFAA
jgi:MFS family permease